MELLGAQWIVPVEGRPIRDGVIAIEAGQIHHLGHISEFEGSKINHMGNVVILPGLVNAHCHLELGYLHDRIPRRPFWDWIEAIIEESKSPGEEERRKQSIISGADQSLRAGVTCVGDISRTGLSAEVLAGHPLRKVCFIELISGAVQPPNDFFSLAARFDSLSALQDERMHLGVSPHAPYTVSPDDLQAAVEFAERRKCPLTMHYLETPEELGWLLQDNPELSEFMGRHCLPRNPRHASRIRSIVAGIPRRCRPLFAHVNYAPDEAGWNQLIPAGASVAFCPRTHDYFGHMRHPWREYLARGINVCLGTDSLASNPSLSILEEMRALHRTAPDVPASLIVAMGTLHAADGLCLGGQIGSLRAGKSADLITIPLEGDCDDPLIPVLDGTTDVTQVWIAGRPMT